MSPLGAGVCLPLPDPAQDSGDQSDLLHDLLVDLLLDLLERDQGLGLDLARLNSKRVMYIVHSLSSKLKAILPLPSPNSEMFFISLLINSVMRETPSYEHK